MIKATSLDDLMTKYKVCKNRIELLDGYPGNMASSARELTEFKLKSGVALALHKLNNSAQYNNIAFRVQAKPTSRLFALEQVSTVRALRIVPLVYKIDTPPSNGVVPPATVEVTVNDKTKFHLKRCVEKTCVG